MNLILRVKTVSKEEIYRHLKECDGDYTPALSSMVDLFDYATKVFEKTVSFEAWDEDTLIGMVNTYLNDMDTRTGFITNVGVLRGYWGKGVASILLHMCLEHAREHHFQRIRLQVSPHNDPAIRLYSSTGFKVIEENFDTLLMECEILGKTTEELQ